MSKKKSETPWRDKLERVQEPKIVDIPPRMQKQWGSGTMGIARPLDVDTVMKTPRKGKLITVKQIMGALSEEYGTDTLCPMTTGIFVRVAAETAEEDLAAGKKRVTPYWRTIKSDGKLNDKYPGGTTAQARKLREEGIEIEPGKGKQPPRVKNFEKLLANLG